MTNESNRYGDGTVFEGVRSKDSIIPTLQLATDLEGPHGMTDEEIGKIWDANVPILNTENVLAFTRAIERHVGEQLGKESAMQQIAIEAKVREECAVICEGIAFTVKTVGTDEHGLVADACAEAIRGRGKE